MKLPSPRAIYLRKWWWSQKPFYLYEDERKLGWGHLTDSHPGLFNLAWAAAGGPLPPRDYGPYAERVTWVFNEGDHIRVGAGTLADWAFKLPLPVFLTLIRNSRGELSKWPYHTPGLTYAKLRKSLAGVSPQDA